ncbi:NAD-dependent succinate-semialdehyde dehydrogenase [soil metagenome]
MTATDFLPRPQGVVAGPYIDGVTDTSGRSSAVDDPATGGSAGEVFLAAPAHVDRAVAVARPAQREWVALGAHERQRILGRCADGIRTNVDAIATLLAAEQGKPLVDSRKEILFGADVIDFYAAEAIRTVGEIRQSATPGIRSIVDRVSFGIVGAITPWNYPVDLWCWKVGGALAAGNAVIVKPPLETPLACHHTAQLMIGAGLPPGVLANLPGGADVATALIDHPDVAMVSITASTATGRAAMATAAQTLTPLVLELGGHAPFIVARTADIETAAAAACRRSFSNMGQICVAVNRILVEESVADEFVDALAAHVDRVETGDPLNPATAYGPVTTDAVRTTAHDHTTQALSAGARLIRGSVDLVDDGPGRYVSPILLDAVPRTATVVNDETFGPVVAVRRVPDLGAAIEEANSLPVGLVAYLYGDDVTRLWSVAEQLEFGMIGINVNDTTELQAPFGGWKLSGFGSELGREGLNSYTRVRHIRMRMPADSPVPADRRDAP